MILVVLVTATFLEHVYYLLHHLYIDSLHDRLHLVLNGEQFHITVAEFGPSFSMKFSSIQHSEDYTLELKSKDEDDVMSPHNNDKVDSDES